MPNNNAYQTILQEIETNTVQKEVWLEAFEKAHGDHDKAVSIYVTLRGEQIYRSETSFHRRAADSVVQVCDLQTKRGRIIAALAVPTLLIGSLLIAQPFLHRSASQQYQSLTEKARESRVIGGTAQELFRELGEPKTSEINGNTLSYTYNPSSLLCLGKQKYNLKFFVDNQTGRISGMQQSALLSSVTK